MNVNIYNPYVRRELELYHHGILGQLWGKRNGPPYPLDSGDHSANEKKAGWRDSLDKNKVKKAVIVGGAVAATALAAIGAYHLYKSGVLDELVSRGKDIADNKIDLDKLDIEKTEPTEIDPDMANLEKINPEFLTNVEYRMNCGNCAIANELIKRGEQNVTAGKNMTGMTVDQFGSYFKGLKHESYFKPKLENISDIKISFDQDKMDRMLSNRGKEVADVLRKGLASQFPKGSRGAMFVPTFQGSHWISWKISDTGKVVFENPQWTGLDMNNFLGKYIESNDYPLTGIRLDNAEIDMSRMGEVVNIKR